MKSSRKRKTLYFISGVMLAMIAIFTISFAFIPLTDAKIIIFPFMFEGVSNVTAILMSLMFFSMFVFANLLPFYLNLKQSRDYEWDEGIYNLKGSRGSRNKILESIEYVITTEISDNLKDTIYIEDNLDEIVLRSKIDPEFKKNYNLPNSYVIDSVESAYEDGFLLMKIKLFKD
jgi:hypothetical protein